MYVIVALWVLKWFCCDSGSRPGMTHRRVCLLCMQEADASVLALNWLLYVLLRGVKKVPVKHPPRLTPQTMNKPSSVSLHCTLNMQRPDCCQGLRMISRSEGRSLARLFPLALLKSWAGFCFTAAQVHVLAHSMGSQIAAASLYSIAEGYRLLKRDIQEVAKKRELDASGGVEDGAGLQAEKLSSTKGDFRKE